MIATWMLYATLVGVFASLAAHALDRAARVNRVATRFIWLAAMVATVVAPAIVYAVQWRALTQGDSAAGVTIGQPLVEAPVGRLLPAPPPSFVDRFVAEFTNVASVIDRPIAILWAALSIMLLGRLAHATLSLWRRRREWTVREIDGVPLFVTPDLGPAVVALPSSRILVPEWLLSLDESHITTVLRHEREHYAAGDARTLVGATVLTAIMPWNVGLWWQMRRLRLAVEMDCDARVLRVDPRVDRYGTLLLAIAQHPRTALHSAATLTESTSDLERRIDAMTSKPSSAPRIIAGASAVMAVLAIAGACMIKSPDVIVAPAGKALSEAPAVIGADQAYYDYQVEKAVQWKPSNPPPRFPTQLRTARIGGTVVAKFLVDTNGRVDLKTFEVIKSDHDLFSNAVRENLSKISFSPAEVGGHKVRQLVQMPFVFSLSDADGGPADHALVDVPASMVSPPIPAGIGGRRQRYEEVPAIGSALTPPTVPVREGLRGKIAPQYPEALRAAGIEGSVVASFVVKDDGYPDPRTLEIIRSDHEQFTNAVRRALPNMWVHPSKLAGAVGRRVTMPFDFKLTSEGKDSRVREAPQAAPSHLVEVPVGETTPPSRLSEVAVSGAPAQAARSSGFLTVAIPDGADRVRATPPAPPPSERQVTARTARGVFEEVRAAAERPESVTVATPLPNQPAPQYPNQLRAANIEGKVVARFTVRADGTADMSTFVAEKSDHDLFTNAVRDALPRIKFAPATRNGIPFSSELTLPFVFSLSH